MFITFEGIEGAGKSTMIALLANHIRNDGEIPVITREPGASQLGRHLRSLLLDCRHEPAVPEAELFLFLADRAQNIANNIRPALEAGQIVLCDRFSDSTLAYQSYGRGMPLAELRSLATFAAGGLKPDLTLLFDLPVATGLARAGERNRQEGTIISEGRFDSESQRFHEKVRAGYLELAREEPDRIKVISADNEPDRVFRDCVAAWEQLKARMAHA